MKALSLSAPKQVPWRNKKTTPSPSKICFASFSSASAAAMSMGSKTVGCMVVDKLLVWWSYRVLFPLCNPRPPHPHRTDGTERDVAYVEVACVGGRRRVGLNNIAVGVIVLT